MKKILLLLILTSFFASCSKNKSQDVEGRKDRQETTTKPITKEMDRDVRRRDTLEFFGYSLALNDSVKEQLRDICKESSKLSMYVNNHGVEVVNIVGVEFAINYDGGSSLILMSSQLPESKQVRRVINYFNSIYGKCCEDDDEDWLWASMYKGKDVGRDYYIKLRHLHSEESGTVIKIGL